MNQDKEWRFLFIVEVMSYGQFLKRGGHRLKACSFLYCDSLCQVSNYVTIESCLESSLENKRYSYIVASFDIFKRRWVKESLQVYAKV